MVVRLLTSGDTEYVDLTDDRQLLIEVARIALEVAAHHPRDRDPSSVAELRLDPNFSVLVEARATFKCGHSIRWKDVSWWLLDRDGGHWCPACLPGDLRRGEVVFADPFAAAAALLGGDIAAAAVIDLTQRAKLPALLGLT